MQDQIHTLKQQALNDLQQVDNTESLPVWFRDYLGKKGAVTALLKQLGTVAAEERPQVGKAINDLKTAITLDPDDKNLKIELKALIEEKNNQEGSCEKSCCGSKSNNEAKIFKSYDELPVFDAKNS